VSETLMLEVPATLAV